MQIEPKVTVYDTVSFSIKHPTSPEGFLFTYYPSEKPEVLHFHDFLELGYCEQGNGLFNVNGQVIPFNGKCISIIYGGQPHIAQSINVDKSLWHFLYIDLNYLFASGNDISASFLKKMKFNNWQKYDFPSIIHEANHPAFYQICKSILQEAANFKDDSITIIQALTYSLLSMHQRMFVKNELSSKVLSNKRDLMQELGDTINYINKYYFENITIEKLTEISKMSKSNLQRKMKELVGMAPLQYIHSLRMKYATAFLSDNRKTISEIATEVGYCLSSFNRQFYKEFKCSPSEWKKMNN